MRLLPLAALRRDREQWCPFKIQKEKLAGLQLTSADYLSLLLTPLRIRWTIPLRFFLNHKSDII